MADDEESDDRLQERLRNWVRSRLEEKDEERGEKAALARALHVSNKWVSLYIKDKPERHLTIDQMVRLMKHFELNIHQIIDEMPLPVADYETRQMLSVWEPLRKGHPARVSAYEMLLYVLQQPHLFQPGGALLPVDKAAIALFRKAGDKPDKKHGGGRGGR